MKLLRFYQQYKVEDFESMTLPLFMTLVNGMEQLTAEEQLLTMDAVSYPHSNDKGRRKSHRKWSKIAYPESFENKVLKTTDLELF